MPAFAYKAIDRTGKRLSGSLDAASSVALARTLEDRGLVVVAVADAAPNGAQPRTGARGGKRQGVLDATRALAALLPAGLALSRALAAAATVATGIVAERLAAVRQRVDRGDSLASALAEHADIFPAHYIGVVRAAERSGQLDEAFARLATELEREESLRGKLISAAIYPALLAGVGGIAVLVLLLFVLPRFAELLRGAGAQLPRSTATLLALSDMTRAHWLALFVPVIFVAGLVAWARTTAEGAHAFSSLLLGLPLVGTLRRLALSARFARLTAVLLGGGAPLLAALDDASESVGDPLARAEVERIRARVREGAPLHRAIDEGTLWSPLLAQLVAVGEESGRLREFLSKAAEIFEQRTERATTRLVALAEPTMIVVFGALVGFVALSLLQAIYGVNASSFR
ncbi:MAG TPA: type II secretion system F family protein [Gemmatimonadaceae bacterium]|nr:type II secretion system F family protein [Gemmatimonadaceae bacterium]